MPLGWSRHRLVCLPSASEATESGAACRVWSLHLSERFQAKCLRASDVSPCRPRQLAAHSKQQQQRTEEEGGEGEPPWLEMPLVWPGVVDAAAAAATAGSGLLHGGLQQQHRDKQQLGQRHG